MKVTIFLFLLFSCEGLMAQQDAIYSQYMFNSLAINPAISGCRKSINATVLRRMQWVGIPGAPTTTTLVVDVPMKDKQFGLGLVLVNDNIGVSTSTGVSANYSYSIQVSKKGRTLSFGLNGTIQNFQMNFADVNTFDPDPEFSSNFSSWKPNIGAGILYNTNNFHLGVSVPHIINNQLNNQDVMIGTEEGKQVRHLYLMSGYVFKLNNYLNLTASTLVKFLSKAPFQVDLAANLWFYSKMGIGFGYRTSSDLLGLAQFRIGELVKLGYAFDYHLNNLINYGSGTHEIVLQVFFSKPKHSGRSIYSKHLRKQGNRVNGLSYINRLF